MKNISPLAETTANPITKAHKQLQNRRLELSTLENKAILYLISKIRPDDTPETHYIFNCREFQGLIRWNPASSYENIRRMLRRIASVQWWIDLDEHTEALVSWFHIIHMASGTGNIEISFHEDIFPLLYELQDKNNPVGSLYANSSLQNMMLLKHRYSSRIYELLQNCSITGQPLSFENGTRTNQDLQMHIADNILDPKSSTSLPSIPKHWSNWAVFKRDVLDPAVKEINSCTDIQVSYEGKKEDLMHNTTRATRTVIFYVTPKPSKPYLFTVIPPEENPVY